jgi:hypothetical protein
VVLAHWEVTQQGGTGEESPGTTLTYSLQALALTLVTLTLMREKSHSHTRSTYSHSQSVRHIHTQFLILTFELKKSGLVSDSQCLSQQ